MKKFSKPIAEITKIDASTIATFKDSQKKK